ncbi:hypothetical protein Bbelb_235910 [Branchiostoma belcheri]|nr:hypothetical protein Bbelb_235910 [Branchiostoma belcheri]
MARSFSFLFRGLFYCSSDTDELPDKRHLSLVLPLYHHRRVAPINVTNVHRSRAASVWSFYPDKGFNTASRFNDTNFLFNRCTITEELPRQTSQTSVGHVPKSIGHSIMTKASIRAGETLETSL